MNPGKFTHSLNRFFVSGVLALSIGSQANAMSPVEDDSTRPTIGRSGEMFTIQFTPASRKLTVGLVGKPALTIDSKKVTIFGRVIPTGSEPKSLKIVPVSGHFEISDELPEKAPIEIEIKDLKTKKTEKFRLDQKQP